jgi:hypothetical protein
MSEGLSTITIDRLLTDTRAALDRIRTTPAEPAGPTGAGVLTTDGTDAGERVTATVSLPGRLTSLTMDPRLLRQGSAAVCSAVIEAVNAGLAALQTSALDGVQRVDVESLAAQLEQVQVDALQSASTMFSALQDTMDRITRQD